MLDFYAATIEKLGFLNTITMDDKENVDAIFLANSME